MLFKYVQLGENKADTLPQGCTVVIQTAELKTLPWTTTSCYCMSEPTNPYLHLQSPKHWETGGARISCCHMSLGFTLGRSCHLDKTKSSQYWKRKGKNGGFKMMLLRQALFLIAKDNHVCLVVTMNSAPCTMSFIKQILSCYKQLVWKQQKPEPLISKTYQE